MIKATGETSKVDGEEASPLPPIKPRLGARLRAYFFAGILITAPLSITFYLAALFVGFVDRQVTPLIPAHYNPETYLPFSIPGLGLVIVIISMILIGALSLICFPFWLAGFSGEQPWYQECAVVLFLFLL